MRCHCLRGPAPGGIFATDRASGSSSHGQGRRERQAAVAAYVDCMRSHGVPNLPDPGPEGGVQLAPGSGINTSSPSFKAAQATCAKLLPGGQQGVLGTASKQFTEQMLAMSKCMRAHGVGGFPDPTHGPPPSDPQEFAIAMGSNGVSLLVPKTIDVSSPAFKQAAAGCHLGARSAKANEPRPRSSPASSQPPRNSLRPTNATGHRPRPDLRLPRVFCACRPRTSLSRGPRLSLAPGPLHVITRPEP